MAGQPKKVIFLGPKYTFSHEAAQRMFPKAELFYDLNPKAIFERTESGEMDYGILAVENSTTGLITEFYPLLVDQHFLLPDPSSQLFSDEVEVMITKELYLPIRHHILVRKKMALADVRTLYTHRQPYFQCIDWVRANLSTDVRPVYTESTADAAEKLEQDTKAGCIGGDLLAKEENLMKLRVNIQDYTLNMTRFFAVSSKHRHVRGKRDKTTLALIIPDRVGALRDVLTMISSGQINVLNVKTLPRKDAQYSGEVFKDWFVMDLAIDNKAEPFLDLLSDIQERKELIQACKVLGSYPSGLRGKPKRRQKRPSVEATPKDKQTFYREMLASGESETVEFKETLRCDSRTGQVNKALPKVIARTVCAFLNSEGGHLLIGVSDAGQPVGIDRDIRLLSKKTVDAFLRAFYEVITKMVGKEYCQYVHAEIVGLQGKPVCCVKVDRSGRPAWLIHEGKSALFVRAGSRTEELDPRQANDYIMSRLNVR